MREEKEQELIRLGSTIGDDKSSAPLGMPGETWLIPATGLIIGIIMGVLCFVAGSIVGAVFWSVGFGGGLFAFSVWAWKDRSPRWFDCRLKTFWFGPHAEISGVIHRRRDAAARHPYRRLS